MIAPTCQHTRKTSKGRDRKGQQRWKCKDCGACFTDYHPKPLGDMQVNVDKAKLALRMLTEGMSIRATERTTGINRSTLCKLVVLFGTACRRFLDDRMHTLKLTHLQFDEQWTFVGKKQARLTIEEKATCHDIGDVYLWTCIDQQTKLMPAFLIGKRSADNARRFLSDVSKRLPSLLRTPVTHTRSRKADTEPSFRFRQTAGLGILKRLISPSVPTRSTERSSKSTGTPR